MTSEMYPMGRNNNIAVQELNEEILVYNFSNNKAFCLNKASAMVWTLCDGNNSILQISEKLSEKFKTTVNEDFVLLALDQLQKENLIEKNFEFPTEFSSLSRRAVIKKIGLGTMLALPIISSVIAPTAVNAASCLPPTATCTSSSQCCSTTSVVSGRQSNGTTPTGIDYTFTGGCCRNGSGPYGANQTCVPGPSSGFTVPCGIASHNGATVGCPTTGNVVCR